MFFIGEDQFSFRTTGARHTPFYNFLHEFTAQDTSTAEATATSSPQKSDAVSDPSGASSSASAEGTADAPTPSERSGKSLRSAPNPRTAATTISCAAGTIYSISSSGQLYVVTSSGATAVGTPAGDSTSNFNNLGIGSGGDSVFAINRSTSSGYSISGTIYKLNLATGVWASTGVGTGNTQSNLIGGAVNLKTGDFYYGGYVQGGATFRIYRYNPTAGTTAFVGTVNTSSGAASNNNGDIAFDADGNMFIVRGNGGTTMIFSVTAANLAGASGGSITSSVSASTSGTLSDVNGTAFDSAGKGYLGSTSNSRSYSMPGWTAGSDFAGLSNSTDLASCSSPATITVQKDVVGRVKATDQFTLTAKRGSTTLGTTTTTGTATGVQTEILGPLPAARNTELSFSEAAANGADLSNYSSAYECKADGVHMDGASGTGTSGTVTIPTGTNAVVCTIKNSPLTANVTIHKDVADANGQNPVPGQGWTMGAATSATTGTVTSNPTSTTQTTNASGDASWALKFGTTGSIATVNVSETQQTGYAFDKGSCTITHLDGTKETTTLTGESAKALTGLKPGDSVNCTYQNKVATGKLTLKKVVDNTNGGSASPTAWTLNAAGPTNISGATGSSVVTNAQVDPGTYTLSEAGGPAGYEQSGVWDCGTAKVTDSKVSVKAGDSVTCTITNKSKPGSVTWTKTDESGNALKGSEWNLSGPGGYSKAVVDCTSSPCDASKLDEDPAAGSLKVSSLKWGEYTLTETKAPVGYQKLADPQHVTIDGDHLSVSFGQIKNDQATAPSLPLTGGRGAQAFLFGGLALLALAMGGGIYTMRRRRNRA